MKKIPTLFQREFENHKVVRINPIPTPGCEWVLNGEGVATIKWDGACCALIDGQFFKRYDAKRGKPIPKEAIKCQDEADPITNHLPCWIPCKANDPSDKWFVEAIMHSLDLNDGTYEAIGPHFQGNPYHLEHDTMIRHGKNIIPDELLPRTFDGIKNYLQAAYDHNIAIEGIVFWKDNEPKCKIKSSDFNINWRERPLIPNHI